MNHYKDFKKAFQDKAKTLIMPLSNLYHANVRQQSTQSLTAPCKNSPQHPSSKNPDVVVFKHAQSRPGRPEIETSRLMAPGTRSRYLLWGYVQSILAIYVDSRRMFGLVADRGTLRARTHYKQPPDTIKP